MKDSKEAAGQKGDGSAGAQRREGKEGSLGGAQQARSTAAPKCVPVTRVIGGEVLLIDPRTGRLI